MGEFVYLAKYISLFQKHNRMVKHFFKCKNVNFNKEESNQNLIVFCLAEVRLVEKMTNDNHTNQSTLLFITNNNIK